MIVVLLASVVFVELTSATFKQTFDDVEECPRLQTFNTIEQYRASISTGYRIEDPLYQVIMTQEAETNGAYCLDGSVPDFYYRSGSGDGINKFIIYLQGGGWCGSIENCVQRSGTYLGSSKFNGAFAYPSYFAPYLSSNQSLNPLTYNWNTIYVPYCDASSFTSDNETVLQYNSTVNLYWRGFRILKGVINVLQKKLQS